MTPANLLIRSRSELEIRLGHMGLLLYFLGELVPIFDESFSNGTALVFMLSGVGCVIYAWRPLLLHHNIVLHTSHRLSIRLHTFFSFKSIRRDKVSQIKVDGDHLFIFFEQDRKRHDFTIRELADNDVKRLVDFLQSEVQTYSTC